MSKLAAFRRGRSLGAKISGEGVVRGNIFWFLHRHILLSDSANCTVLRAVVLTQYWHVTDGQTDGIAVASTALAMRALRRDVKTLASGLAKYRKQRRSRQAGLWCVTTCLAKRCSAQ